MALALAGCAGGGASVGRMTPRQDLPSAARALVGSVAPTTAGGPVAVRLGDPRADAEATARGLVDALLRADEGAIGALLADTVEGAEGEAAEGREQVVALLRPWLPHIARTVAPGTSTPSAPRLSSPDDCARGACRQVFLRRGDWFVELPFPGLRPAPSFAPPRGVRGSSFGMGAPTSAPPRYVVLRPIDGGLRVVAVNDDLLRGR